MLRIEPLAPHHDRRSFGCGTPALDHYLQRIARQYLGKGSTRTFVLVDEESPGRISGFFTLSLCEVDSEKLPPRWAKKGSGRIPVAKLTRLALAKRHHGRGYGAALLYEAMRRVVLGAERFDVVAFFVDAKDEAARSYCRRFGFLSFPENKVEMFLPMETVRATVLRFGSV